MNARASQAPSSCKRLSVAVETFLDGELEPSQVVDVETHLTSCGCCREKVALHRSVRASLRTVVPLKAPSSLRDRVRCAMAAEAARTSGPVDAVVVAPVVEAAPAALVPVASALPTAPAATPLPIVVRRGRAPRKPASGPMRARYLVPFAVAAAAAFAVASKSPLPDPNAAPPLGQASIYNTAGVASVAAGSMGLDGILDDLVSLHAQPLPPEVTQQDEVRRFDPFVGVPVEPPKLQPFGAKWVGGRVLPIRDSRAAMLQYAMGGGHRVTVYVYDPRRVRQESRTLQARTVRNASVLVGSVRGYNVAATERQGVGYALATDLGDAESAELVAAAFPLAAHRHESTTFRAARAEGRILLRSGSPRAARKDSDDRRQMRRLRR